MSSGAEIKINIGLYFNRNKFINFKLLLYVVNKFIHLYILRPMNKFLFVFILISLASLTSAEGQEDNRHLILKYIFEIDSVFGDINEEFYPEMSVSFQSSLFRSDPSDPFTAALKGQRPFLPFYYNIMGKTLSVGDKEFEEIALRYRDTSFHKDHHFPWRGEVKDPVINDTLLEIHIVCNRDYDSLHPKGHYLDDIVGISYDRHVMNPMKDYRLIDKPKTQFLSDYNVNSNHAYMLPKGSWGLLKPPSNPGQYLFKLILITENGKKYELNYKPIHLTTKVAHPHMYY